MIENNATADPVVSDHHPNWPIWRLIPPIEASGSVQMAVDCWLLDQHRRGLQSSVLRFYTWSPPAISLGYHQRHWPDHWRQLTWQGRAIDIVRRPTGGRAVLHQGDLTYAIITSKLAGDRTEAYKTLCQFLIEGWGSLGVRLFYGEAGRSYIDNLNCFKTATVADLVTVNGSKLIGSAQLRRDNAILQHGSICLDPDPLLFQQVFGTELQPIGLPLDLSQGPRVELHQVVINALTKSAQMCFSPQFNVQPLSEGECKEALDCFDLKV